MKSSKSESSSLVYSGVSLYSASRQQNQLKLDQLNNDVLTLIFSFLDEKEKLSFARIKNEKNAPLYNRLMQDALLQHFLQIVAEGRPPQYDIQFMPDESKQLGAFQPGTLYVKLVSRRGSFGIEDIIEYTVLNPQNKISYGEITLQDINQLNFPIPFNLETIKTILPDILEVTAAREQTYATAAEKLLAADPELKKLLLQRGNLTDYAGNHFTRITAFQYAIWAKDRHMWAMLKEYMPPEEVANQLAEMQKNTFKMQHGSYWDCPKEYDLHLVSMDNLPTLEDLQQQEMNIPTLIYVKDQSEYHLFGYSDDGVTPQLIKLDKKGFSSDFDLQLEVEGKQIIFINTKNHPALHEEIEAKNAHFVNPLAQALKKYDDPYKKYLEDNILWTKNDDLQDRKKAAWTHLNELFLKVGEAQRHVPVHVVNEYCRLDKAFKDETDLEKVLPRTCKLKDGDSWYPLRDNEAGRLGLVEVVKQNPTLKMLQEMDCKIPTLIKKINPVGYPNEFYLYGLKQDRKTPVLSPAFWDLDNDLDEINFSKPSIWLFKGSRELSRFASLPMVFGSLGVNYGIARGKLLSQAESISGDGVTSLVGSDLATVTSTCHNRTLEVMDLKQSISKVPKLGI